MRHLCVVLAVFAMSCSFVFSRPPDRARPLPLCQPNYVPPVIDTVEAIGGGVLTLAALGHVSSDGEPMALIAGIAAVETAVFAAAAAHGFKHARSCRELREEVAHGGPMWITPSVPPGELPVEGPPVEGPPFEVEQEVDVTEDEVDIRTTIRRTR